MLSPAHLLLLLRLGRSRRGRGRCYLPRPQLISLLHNPLFVCLSNADQTLRSARPRPPPPHSLTIDSNRNRPHDRQLRPTERLRREQRSSNFHGHNYNHNYAHVRRLHRVARVAERQLPPHPPTNQPVFLSPPTEYLPPASATTIHPSPILKYEIRRKPSPISISRESELRPNSIQSTPNSLPTNFAALASQKLPNRAFHPLSTRLVRLSPRG